MSSLEPTDDAFLGGRLSILQPAKGYRAGLDAILLAASVRQPGLASLRVLDCGAGVGVVGLAVAARLPSAQVILVEREPELCQLAHANIQRNGLSDRVSVIAGNVEAPAGNTTAPDLAPQSFDAVLCNPPYHDGKAATRSADPLKSNAHAMETGALDRWARFAARIARPAARLSFIHKASALPEILRVCEGRFGDLTVLPIYPYSASIASRVLVMGRKGSRAPMRILTGLVIHETSGAFTRDVEEILRHGAGLPIDDTGEPAAPTSSPVPQTQRS